MGTMGNWMLLAPLLAALLILLYTAWQAFKEIQPTLLSIKSLQQEFRNTQGIVNTLVAEIQSAKANITEQSENAKELISYSKEAYSNVKGIVGTVRNLDTVPVRHAVSYFKQKREERHVPQPLRSVKTTARKINAKLQTRELGQLSLLATAVAGAGALLFIVRRSL